MSFLKGTIAGRIGTMSEIKYTAAGMGILNLSIPINDRVKDEKGNYEEVTQWVKATLWGKTAENCAQYKKKGDWIYLDGKISISTWENKDGETKTSLELNVSDMKFIGDSREDREDSGDKVDTREVAPKTIKDVLLKPTSKYADSDDFPF